MNWQCKRACVPVDTADAKGCDEPRLPVDKPCHSALAIPLQAETDLGPDFGRAAAGSQGVPPQRHSKGADEQSSRGRPGRSSDPGVCRLAASATVLLLVAEA